MKTSAEVSLAAVRSFLERACRTGVEGGQGSRGWSPWLQRKARDGEALLISFLTSETQFL